MHSDAFEDRQRDDDNVSQFGMNTSFDSVRDEQSRSTPRRRAV